MGGLWVCVYVYVCASAYACTCMYVCICYLTTSFVGEGVTNFIPRKLGVRDVQLDLQVGALLV